MDQKWVFPSILLWRRNKQS